MSVTIKLADEIDISRGDMLVHQTNVPRVDHRFDAMMVWLSERPLDRQKSYLLKHTTQLVRAEIEDVAFTVDLETLKQSDAARLELNDIGRVTISCRRPLYFDPYKDNRVTGAFILVDSLSNNTVAAGMILPDAPLKEETDGTGPTSFRPRSQVSPDERSERLGQKGATVWLTGLPASGKTAIAFALERPFVRSKAPGLRDRPGRRLVAGRAPRRLSPAQTPELARRSTDAGIIPIFAYASPLIADRLAIRDAVGPERFVEIYVKTSLETRKKRDQRGAYGPGHPQPSEEAPKSPDLVVSLDNGSEQAAQGGARPPQGPYHRGVVKRGLLPSAYAL